MPPWVREAPSFRVHSPEVTVPPKAGRRCGCECSSKQSLQHCARKCSAHAHHVAHLSVCRQAAGVQRIKYMLMLLH